jgi:hypothetical protein
MFKRYKQDAHKKKHLTDPFAITFEEFCSFWKKPCHYCGAAIQNIGVDRKDSLIGYRMDNLVPCCGPCNLMKMRLHYDEFLRRCRAITEHCNA